MATIMMGHTRTTSAKRSAGTTWLALALCGPKKHALVLTLEFGVSTTGTDTAGCGLPSRRNL